MKPIEETRVGDVLRWPSGSLRVVRKISCGRHRYMYFAIRHCSWTKRPYTLYMQRELKYMGVTNTGVNIRFKDWLSEQLEWEFSNGDKPEISCCMVTGLP